LTVEFIVRVQDRISDIAADRIEECQTDAEEYQRNVEVAYEAIRQHKEVIDDAVSDITEFELTIDNANTEVKALFEDAEDKNVDALETLLEETRRLATTATESMTYAEEA
jgi:gas vesicle protein